MTFFFFFFFFLICQPVIIINHPSYILLQSEEIYDTLAGGDSLDSCD